MDLGCTVDAAKDGDALWQVSWHARSDSFLAIELDLTLPHETGAAMLAHSIYSSDRIGELCGSVVLTLPTEHKFFIRTLSLFRF